MDESKRAVLLVDNKRRDLRSLALIAMHLQNHGAEVFIEPLESWRGVLAAYRPHLILFNHLTASHLANYSARLRDLGVKVAVMPNESLLYNREVMDFNCRKRNANAHADLYLCWNEVQRAALLHNGHDKTRLEVVGNPKFDFYFEPWSHLYRSPEKTTGQRPKILFCTNFSFAKYKELPRAEADKLFDLWARQIPLYSRYWEAIEENHRSQRQALAFILAALKTQKYDITLRPHPNEQAAFYEAWLASLSPELRARIRFAPNDSIYSLILDCDLEISCETCTTAIESWLCHKPTIELVFSRHPMFYHEEAARLNVECESQAELPRLIDENLAHPGQSAFQRDRLAHLQKWCSILDGTSSARVARALREVMADAKPKYADGLTLADHRRAAKLKLLQALDLPYNFDPLLSSKATLFPQHYREKRRIYEKTAKPADTRTAFAELAACAGDIGSRNPPG